MDNHFLAIFKTEFSTRKQQGKNLSLDSVFLFMAYFRTSGFQITRTAQATNK